MRAEEVQGQLLDPTKSPYETERLFLTMCDFAAARVPIEHTRSRVRVFGPGSLPRGINSPEG